MKVKCPRCNGTGQVEEPFEPIRCDPPQMITCPECHGSGEIEEQKK